MKHRVPEPGLVVPFGYVTANSDGGNVCVYQQGQFVPAGWYVTAVRGENDADPLRSADALMLSIGIVALRAKAHTALD